MPDEVAPGIFRLAVPLPDNPLVVFAAVQGLVRGRLRVGTEQCLGVIDVPVEVARFQSRYPGGILTPKIGAATPSASPDAGAM